MPASFADRLQRIRYHGLRLAGEGARIALGAGAAGAYRMTGRPEHALRRYGRLVRHVQAAREAIWPYRAMRRCLAGNPERAAAYGLDGVRPEGFLMFVGYGRSGHSLVGSLLDAHPEIVISHEVHALRFLHRGVPFDDVADAIKLNARVFHETGRSYTGYDYVVPGQWQGRYSRLRLLGDKKGNGTVRLIRRHPAVLDRLSETVPVPVTFIHVVRNPFDNIATKARRTNTSPAFAARSYFANAEAIAAMKARADIRVVDVYLDDLVAAPKDTLRRLLGELGIENIDEAYLDACAAIVFERPSRTGADLAWDETLVAEVRKRMAGYPFLRRFLKAPADEGAA